jgi:hypothetical protein
MATTTHRPVPLQQIALGIATSFLLFAVFYATRPSHAPITGDEMDGVLGFTLGFGGLSLWRAVRAGQVSHRGGLILCAGFVLAVITRYVVWS